MFLTRYLGSIGSRIAANPIPQSLWSTPTKHSFLQPLLILTEHDYFPSSVVATSPAYVNESPAQVIMHEETHPVRPPSPY